MEINSGTLEGIEIRAAAAQAIEPDPVESALGYAQAKCRQDVTSALAFCTDDFVMEAIPYGTRAAGRAEVAYDLARFFEMFPDYDFRCASTTRGTDAVVLSGFIRMTSSGRLPSGFPMNRWVRLPRRRVELPATAVFETRGGLLCHERFFFDMNAFCAQLGLPAAVVSPFVRKIERNRSADVHGVPAMRVENSLIVSAPIERVFDFALRDVQQLLRANPPAPLLRANRIELVGGSSIARGTIRRVHVSNGHVTDERIVACEPPRLVRYRIENGWGFPIDSFVAATYGEHVLEPLGHATRITWRSFGVPRSQWSAPIASLLGTMILGPMQRRFHRSISEALDPGRGTDTGADRPASRGWR